MHSVWISCDDESPVPHVGSEEGQGIGLKKYRVLLDPMKMVIVKWHWPHTKIGRKRVVTRQASAELAIHEVSDEVGLSKWLLKAVQIRD